MSTKFSPHSLPHIVLLTLIVFSALEIVLFIADTCFTCGGIGKAMGWIFGISTLFVFWKYQIAQRKKLLTKVALVLLTFSTLAILFVADSFIAFISYVLW
jgi:hypothetical protein